MGTALESRSMVPPARDSIRFGRITVDAASFNHVLAGLDEETIELVTGFLEGCFYKSPKEQVIKLLSVSETGKVIHIMTEKTLGDRVPS